jgi:hypothetical protein
VTFFHSGEEGFEDFGTWERLTREKPDSCQSNPKTRRVIESGVIGESNQQLLFLSEPLENRLEWHLSAQDLSPHFEMGFVDSSSQLLNLMDRYLESLPLQGLERVAYGVNVIQRVSGLPEGYRKISDCLGVNVEYPQCSDFLYQLNRRRPSKILANTDLNRLMKWSVVTLGRRILRFDADVTLKEGKIDPEVVAPDEDQVAVNLELDINTVRKANSRIAKEQVGPLLREFDELAREILAKGNIP